VEVTVNDIPDTPIAGNQSFCGDGTVADLIADGENIQWYDVANGGSPLTELEILVTGFYYVSQTVQGCESERTEIEVIAEDNIAPSAQCFNTIVIQLDVNGQANIDVNTVDNESFDNCGIDTMILSQTAFDCSHIGNNEVTLTITDNSGNVSTCTTIVTVEDSTAPIVVCADVTLELDAYGKAILAHNFIGGDSDDNCGIEVTAVDIEYFNCNDLGEPVSVTFFAMDSSGNIATCSALVTVTDALAPQIECPGEPIEIEAATYTTPNYYEDGLIIVTDNCEIQSVEQDPIPGTVLGEGNHTINLTATDTSGNESSCSFEIVVDDGLSTPEFDLQALKMYPNPARGSVTISNPNGMEIDSINIFDITGKQISQLTINSLEDVVVDVSELPSSVYIIHILIDNNQHVYKRLIIE